MPKPTEPPEQGAVSSDEERFSIVVDPETYRQVLFLAKVWNSIDKARRRKRYRDWGISNVSPSLIRAAVSGVLEELGGYPSLEDEQREVITEMVIGVLREVGGTSAGDQERVASEIVDTVFRDAEEKQTRLRKKKKKK